MNTHGLLAGLACFYGALAPVVAADKPVSNLRSNMVSELRSHDSAFALMMESYRQIQVLMIEADHDKRVQLAKLAPESATRERILALAQQEREQRLGKLRQTLAGVDGAYDTSRKDQQRKTGGELVTRMTSEEAGEQLRHFRPFSPREFRMENQPSQLLPAGARMLYDDKRY